MQIINNQSRLFFLTNLGWLLFTVILFASTLYISMTNEYMKYKRVEVTVVDRFLPSSSLRSSTQYLIVSNPQYGEFEVPVSPTLYTRKKAGETVVFNLREMDIRQTKSKNIVYFFGAITLELISFFYLFFLVYYYVRGYKE